MGLADRVRARTKLSFGGGQGFVQPPFWAVPDQLWDPTPLDGSERTDSTFESLVNGAFKSSGVVAGVIERRAQVFSQGRFMFTQYRNGVPSDPFAKPTLRLLERPWPKAGTGDLLKRCEYDVSLSGNAFWVVCDAAGRLGAAATGADRRLVRLRPDWCSFMVRAESGNPFGPDAVVLSLVFEVPPHGAVPRQRWLFLPNEFAHYAPIPDPIARFRGMSWLTPILTEIDADVAATRHKARFFANGATFSRAIKFDRDSDMEAVKRFRERYKQAHVGVDNAYQTLFLVPGADVVPLSTDFGQLDLKVTQGAGETRVCMAGGVPPAIAGASEGLAGSTLNAGNFQATRRLFVDTTIRDLWNIVATSFEPLIVMPNTDGAALIIDDRFVPFMRDDAKDAAERLQLESAIIAQLTREGFEVPSVIAAVRNRDWTLLKHTGLISVQLHDPSQPPQQPPPTDSNGNGMMTPQMLAAMNGGNNGS